MKYILLGHFHTMLPREAILPSHKVLAELGTKDYVKIGVECTNGRTEKFWAQVKKMDDKGIHVEVNQNLVLTHLHGLKDGSEMLIQPGNINGVLKGGL